MKQDLIVVGLALIGYATIFYFTLKLSFYIISKLIRNEDESTN